MVFTRSELEAQTNLNQPLIASRGGTRAEEASPEEALTGEPPKLQYGFQEPITAAVFSGCDLPSILPALASAKVELYRELKRSGVRKAELARRLGISRGNIDRLFDLHHSTRLELLEQAFAVLGRRLSIAVEKAA